MLVLHKGMAVALADASAGLVGDPPESQAVLVSAREAAGRCPPLCRLAPLARAVLEEQSFVQVRGLPLDQARPLFMAFASLMGEPYIDPAVGSAVVPAHVRPGEALMGNQLRRLPLHTDYSMMERPPRLTMSLCLRPDSVEGFGAVYVADIESACFGVEDEADITRLRKVPLPFAARNSRDEVDVIDRPILGSAPAGGGLIVRYHPSRIRQGFQCRGEGPTPEQRSAMLSFERLAEGAVQVLRPEAGDITVIDNHRTVHGRERCSVEVGADGTTTGRQMMFLFAY
jgi:alpha-ketoglutarate-dependent taurine dioxygenase